MNRWLLALALVVAAGPAMAASLVQSRNLADGTLFSDQVARKVGDLITIAVEESTTVKEEQKTETSRENSVDAKVTVAPATDAIAANAGQSTVGKLPAFAANSKKEFEGEGKFNATGRVATTITARVVDVLDNGNLVIEGRRKVVAQSETKTILVTGICRTADIDSMNNLPSSRLHNFQVSIEGEGPLSRAQQEGFLGRLLDYVWPF
jgi:flagellar L-ring protein precursor FlgH